MPGVADGGPIPDAPPPDFWESTTDTIEDVGEPVSPCFFINTDIDPAGWYHTQLLSLPPPQNKMLTVFVF